MLPLHTSAQWEGPGLSITKTARENRSLNRPNTVPHLIFVTAMHAANKQETDGLSLLLPIIETDWSNWK